MSKTESQSQVHYVWKDKKIGRPPQREEVPLGYTEIRKALLSFKFDMSNGFGTRLDPAQAIVINDKNIAQILDLPQSKKSLEVVERTDIDVTKLLKTNPSGAKNIVEVNYLLSKAAIAKTQFPGATIGTLTLYFTIWFPGREVIVKDKEPTKFCMNCGESIALDSKWCPKCGLQPPSGGPEAKKCRNIDCGALLPPTARYCQKCGKEQAKLEGPVVTCWNCKNILSANSIYCNVCGKSQKQVEEKKPQANTCWNCGISVPANAKFCPSCGKDLQQPEEEKHTGSKTCWNCGSEVTPSDKFCLQCGKQQ